MIEQKVTTSWTLKIDLEGEVRRLSSWPGDGIEPTMEAIRTAIYALFSHLDANAGVLYIKCQNNDGDLCILTDATLADALSCAADSGVLRLTANFEMLTSTPTEKGCGGVLGEPLLQSEAGLSATPTRCLVSQRIASARPHLAQGLANFKQQVLNDFRSNCEDMKSAFVTSNKSDGGEIADAPPQRAALLACKVAGAVAGVAAASRLIPVRGIRLAADSIAAVAGAPPASVDPASPSAFRVDVVGAYVFPSVDTQGIAHTMANAGDQVALADSPKSVAEEVSHFKQQVAQDFELTRQEVEAALGSLCALCKKSSGDNVNSAATDAGANTEQQPPSQRQPRTLKEVVPVVASTFAGLSVASTLVPLRAVRLAVASAAALASTSASHSDQAGAVVEEAAGIEGGPAETATEGAEIPAEEADTSSVEHLTVSS